jgi:DNA-binding transcriptional LysR family regulator
MTPPPSFATSTTPALQPTTRESLVIPDDLNGATGSNRAVTGRAQIAADTLEVELFHRATSGTTRLSLTDAARSVLPALQSGFDLLSEAVEQLKASRSRTVFTVTVPAAFADKWLLRRVERFQQRHPYYDLRINTTNPLLDFTADRIDVGIRIWGGCVARSHLHLPVTR